MRLNEATMTFHKGTKMTQTEISDASGFIRSTIKQWDAGKTAPKKRLEANRAVCPDAFQVESEKPLIQPIGSDGAAFTVTGKQFLTTGASFDYPIRGKRNHEIIL